MTSTSSRSSPEVEIASSGANIRNGKDSGKLRCSFENLLKSQETSASPLLRKRKFREELLVVESSEDEEVVFNTGKNKRNRMSDDDDMEFAEGEGKNCSDQIQSFSRAREAIKTATR